MAFLVGFHLDGELVVAPDRQDGYHHLDARICSEIYHLIEDKGDTTIFFICIPSCRDKVRCIHRNRHTSIQGIGIAFHGHRLDGASVGAGVLHGDIQRAGEVFELERGAAGGVGGHREVEDLVAGAVGAVVVVGGEGDGGVVGAPVDSRQKGGIEGAVGAFGDAGVADIGAVAATFNGGGGAVDAYLVAASPGGVEAVEDHLAAAVHGFGKDLDHAVGGIVFRLLAPHQRQQGGEEGC